MHQVYSKEPLACPVCKVILGTRNYSNYQSVYCFECKATFHFIPYNDKPSATTDKQKELKCGCGRCGR